jgi:serine/threonine protein kinase
MSRARGNARNDPTGATRRLGDDAGAGPTVRLAPDPHEAPTARAAGPEERLVLGRYRLGRRLGVGGFGVVWRARDERLERDVALKVIPHDGDPDADRRVEREAQAAARLNHPGIVALYEFAADAHDVYLVSELVPGGTLAELGRGGGLADADVARIGIALSPSRRPARASRSSPTSASRNSRAGTR